MKRTIFLIHFFAGALSHAKYPTSDSWAMKNVESAQARELLVGHIQSEIPVAVVDTGIDESNADLRAALWTNPKEIPDNGIDDDGNGYIDDVHGWDFVSNSPRLADKIGHGTHVSGIILSLAPQARLMVLKYYDSRLPSSVNVENALRAFRYAIQMRASIVNFSGGGEGFNFAEMQLMREAERNNILVVAAAGNGGADTDQRKYYPASYPLRNILSVTAINRRNQRPAYANWGRHTVDLAAPGDEIVSSLPGGVSGEMSGTSQATAFATGAASLLLSQTPSLKPHEIADLLRRSGQPTPSFEGKSKTSAKLDLFRAMTMKDQSYFSSGVRISNLGEMDQSVFTIRPSR